MSGTARDTAARRRAGRAVALLLVVFALAIAVLEWWLLFYQTPHPFGDLTVYRGAIRHVAAGGSLYEFLYYHPGLERGYGFTYPPFAAVVLRPLTWGGEDLSNRLWTGATFLICVGLAAALVSRLARHPSTWAGQAPTRARRVGLVAGGTAVLLLSSSVVHNLVVGQVSLLIVALAFVDAARIVPPRFQGALVGLAAAIKLTPLVFLPYWLVTRQWRQAAMMMGVFLGAAGVGFLLYPADSATYWSDALFDTSRVGDVVTSRNKSILGFMSRWEVGGESLAIVWIVVCLLVSAAALAQARNHFTRSEHVQAALVMGCLSVAVSPISWSHHQTWAVLAGVLLLFQRRPLHSILGALVLASFLTFSPLVGLEETGPLALRIAWEIPTAMILAIAVCGLPRDRVTTAVVDGPLSGDETGVGELTS